MKRTFLQWLAMAGVMTCAAHASAAEWDNKTIQQFQPDHPYQNCFFFILNGVTTADSSVSTSAWFAVDRAAHPGAEDLAATLLTARITGTPITVVTSGTAACGYAGVSYVIM
jgi:hypothetical protein